MPEILLHYLWQRGIFLAYEQYTTDGRRVEVLSVGVHNTDAGPDFTNVRLRIDGVEMVGNVEMHILSSDWYRHRHHLDARYDHLVMHVVRKADKPIYDSAGQPIVQMELRYPDDHDYLQLITQDALWMDTAMGTHRCAKHLMGHPSFITDGWKRTMLVQRLDCKQRAIEQIWTIMQHDYAQAFYITLAHHFGFHVNGIPFEMLAIHTPLIVLLKHRNSLFQLTAILLGQAGLLPERVSNDREEIKLKREYCFLKHKYGLEPIDASLWKRGRLRPQNAPEMRVRQFAQLLYQTDMLFSQAMEATTMEQLRALFTLQAIPIEVASTIIPPPPMGKVSIDMLIINVVIPFLYVKQKQDLALSLLESLPAEDNTIIRQWITLGQTVHTAADSQALIHLYQTCCQSSHCLNCDVAYQIFLNK